MSWFGGSISSLTGQLSNLTKDILTEGTEEISDPATELRLAKEKIEELHSLLIAQKSETERLKKINKELEEKAESSELQINAISREYRGVLESREKEVNSLKRQHAELLEQQARSAACAIKNDDTKISLSSHAATSKAASSSGFHDHTDSFGSFNYDGDTSDWDFDDSIRLQRENNRLRSDLQNLTAEAKHWRSVAGQLGQKAENQDDNASSSAEVLELQSKIKDLETSLSKKGEQLQQQAASLHEHHRHKVTTLNERHAKEVKTLQEKLFVLEQQLSDAGSGSQHSGTLPESERPNVSSREGELERKLANALSEKEKAQNARIHLEGVLDELQQEVERLQDLNEQQENAAKCSDKEKSLQTKVSELSQQLAKSEEENNQLRTKLQRAHSDAKNEVSLTLMSTKEERDGVMARLEELVSSIGDEEWQLKTAELLNTIDKENILLKEQNAKLEEQVVLLEKTSSNYMQDKQSLLETVAALKSSLPKTFEDAMSEDKDTMDTRFSSTSSSALQVKEDEVEAEVTRLRSELERLMEDSSNFEMEKSDWMMEREALEDVVTELQKKSHNLEDEIQSLKSSETKDSVESSNDQHQKDLDIEVSSLKEEVKELEKALEELDSQHSEALVQLIGQRDKLGAQLSGQGSEIDQYKKEIESLKETIDQMKIAKDDHLLKDLEAKCEKYEQELLEWKEKSKNANLMENKLKNVQEKLEKGGLVINDLHMDKQDLEQQLQEAEEEIKLKVALLKESRLEKLELAKEKQEMECRARDLEERLLESEVELEKWQQLNEEKQVQVANTPGRQEVEIECSRLRSKIEDMEQEKEAIKEFLIEGNKDHGDPALPAVTDTAFQHIFEEAFKVRQKLEEEENIVQELKEYIEKLRNERQGLKEKIALLNSNKKESDSLLESIQKEKAACAEQLEEKIAELHCKESEIPELIARSESVEQEKSNLQRNFTNLQKEAQDLSNSFDTKEKYYEAYIEELKTGKEAGNERLESLIALNSEMESLKVQLNDMEDLRTSLNEKSQEVENLRKDIERHHNNSSTMNAEHTRLEALCEEKDVELETLKEEVGRLEGNLQEMEELVKSTEQQQETEMRNKEEELKSVRKDLGRELSQLKDQLKSNNEFSEKDERLVKLQNEIEILKQDREESEASTLIVSQLEAQLSSSKERIASLEMDLSHARGTIENADTGQSFNSNSERNSNQDIMERGFSKPLLSANSHSYSQDLDEADHEYNHFMILEKEMEELQKKLSEKDGVVSELQRSNSSLLELLEKRADGRNSNLGDRLTNHKLEGELKSLRAEREQMVAVVSEKSRENSSLKSEIHRLMDMVSAGQTALSKVQQDNINLEQQQRQHSPPREQEEDNMKREALNNMARLVRDKDTEIEALTQKNNTLLAVLQESSESEAAAHLGPLLKEKETLSHQITSMMTEREQLIACVTQKHSESLAFHTEVQRLTALLIETQNNADKAKADYTALIPAFEGKNQALLTTQQELVECKQKLKELEIRHGELLQNSNNLQPRDSSTVSDLEAEVEKYKRLECDYKAMVLERDDQVHNLSQKMKMFEEVATSKESECAHFKKQLDNAKFQLTGLMAEIADTKTEKELVQQKSSSQDEESTSLRHNLSEMTLAVKDKDLEIASLKDQISTLNSVLQNKKGEQDQVAMLIKDHESAVATTRQLQQERDYNAMLAEQRLHECDAMKTELSAQKDKIFKLGRELDRLRSHLIEIEEGYTKEALEAEEREKDLRNKLAVAEEQLFTSSSRVQIASQESHRQIESLQEQLHHLASQRDSAYMQVATTQDQCQQYAASLSNLQLVLEHFQKEKDSAIAMETEKYQEKASSLSTQVKDLQTELEATRVDLTEALDGLEAASRLSEQLDRREEALGALKEEVQLREQALKAAEEEISKLKSNTEAKVDKTLMHNMVLTWLTSPEKKRDEIVQLIGHVLDFSPDDFKKIESAHNQDSLWIGLFRPSNTESESNKPAKANQSFSQLFVKFLEKESSPPPTPVKLPVEAMAAEAQLRHKTAFNPFMAPRHVTHGNEAAGLSSGSSSHLLIPQDTPHPSPLFAPVTSVSSTVESAILKDVLSLNNR